MQQKRKAAKDVFLEQQRSAEPDEDLFADSFDDIAEMENDIPMEQEDCEPKIAVQTAYPAAMPPPEILSQENVDGLLGAVNSKPSILPRRESKKPMPRKNKSYIPSMDIKTSEELQLEKEPIKVRITGAFFWKRVIVPPNAFVVHTRINKKEPVTLGLGISFRYNPRTDAYIVIPAAMQTIGVVANCISQEKQGINILAYVQWQIEDFSVAYKKLDLTNSHDPLGIVNAQLREQAEAAIKDKIATMSVEEVLTDKAPIIEELTSRLRRVAEGQEGLGIKIITVQIREAVVSSASLWNDLQSPYRNEQRQKARISQLEMENEINKKELETTKLKQNRQAETDLEIEKTKQEKLTESTELRLQQESRRFAEEQKSIQQKQELEEQTQLKQKEKADRISSHERELKYRQEQEEREYNLKNQDSKKQAKLQQIETEKLLAEKQSELTLLQIKLEATQKQLQLEQNLQQEQRKKDSELAIQRKENEIQFQQEELRARALQLLQQAKNLTNDNQLKKALINKLPEIAAEMPEIKDLRILQSEKGDPLFDHLLTFVHKLSEVTKTF